MGFRISRRTLQRSVFSASVNRVFAGLVDGSVTRVMWLASGGRVHAVKRVRLRRKLTKHAEPGRDLQKTDLNHISRLSTRNAMPPMKIAITISVAEIASAFFQPNSDPSTSITEMQGM